MEETRTHKTRSSIKGNLKQKVVTSVDTEEEEYKEEELGFGEDDRKRKTLIKRSGSSTSVTGVGVSSSLCCQAEKCTSDLSVAKRYHRRHKVCEFHSKSPVVIVAGLRQRFCQQCSRFHELSEFDETKRSCRNRLAGHNERRRKSSSDSHGEGSSSKGVNPELKENHCRQANQSGTRITFPAGDTKHFQIR